MRQALTVGAVSMVLFVAFACSDDEPAKSGGDSGAAGDVGSGGDAGSTGQGGGNVTAGGAGGADAEALVNRGEYLIKHVSVCTDCHTPSVNGVPDLDNFLAGNDCLFDIVPADPELGCVSTPNLTNHATGLENRTDEEIKDMFLKGLRPDGKAMHPIMPYWSFGNMSDQDADAIVAYLRTVPGVDHEVAAIQPPLAPPAEPATRVDLSKVPMPDDSLPDYDSALRGRYLAAQVGVCLECHTPSNLPGSPEPRDLDKAFWGGEEFNLGFVHSVSHNLTPDPTGIGGWSKADVVKALKEGVRPDDTRLCPPMPAGPMGAFAGLTDADANDIAAYLLSLPPAENEVPMCVIDMGGGGAGTGGASAGGAGGIDSAAGVGGVN